MKKNNTEKKKKKKKKVKQALPILFCRKMKKEKSSHELDWDEKSFEEIEIPGTVSKLDAICWTERPCKAREYF